jgi:hypothetical protein
MWIEYGGEITAENVKYRIMIAYSFIIWVFFAVHVPDSNVKGQKGKAIPQHSYDGAGGEMA